VRPTLPALLVGLGALSFGVAAYAIVAYGYLPLGSTVHPAMRKAFEAHRGAVYAHVFASALALALGPTQFSRRLRARHIAIHRCLGGIYLGAGVLIGGLSGLVLARHAFGGASARLGFACLALAWLYTGARAYLAIRARDVASHRAWMIRNFALTFAAVTLRLYLPVTVTSGVDFELAYAWIAWLCWVPNLLVVSLFLKHAERGSLASS
jgi:hypothetical protein